MIPQFLRLNPIPQRGQSAANTPEETLCDFDAVMAELLETDALQEIALADPISIVALGPTTPQIVDAPKHDLGADEIGMTTVATKQESLSLSSKSELRPVEEDNFGLWEGQHTSTQRAAAKTEPADFKIAATLPQTFNGSTAGVAAEPAYKPSEQGGLAAVIQSSTAAKYAFEGASPMVTIPENDASRLTISDNPIEPEFDNLTKPKLVDLPFSPNKSRGDGLAQKPKHELAWPLNPKASKSPPFAALGAVNAKAAAAPGQTVMPREVAKVMSETPDILYGQQPANPPLGRRGDVAEIRRDVVFTPHGNLPQSVLPTLRVNDTIVPDKNPTISTVWKKAAPIEGEIAVPAAQLGGNGSQPNAVVSKDQSLDKKAEQQFIHRVPDFLVQSQEQVPIDNLQAPDPQSLAALPIASYETKAQIAPQPQFAPAIFKQLAPHSTKAKSGEVELLLAPAELGNVKFQIHQQADSVRVVLSAERPETLDLLRRNSEQLLQEFKQAGFSGASLSFGHWDQQGKPSQTAVPMQGLSDEDFITAPQPFAPPNVKTPTLSSGLGLDLRL